MNKVQLIGRLGQDPELKYTPSGAPVANLSIATSEKWTDKQGQKQEKTEWHRCVVWGKLGELCNQYLAKGRQVYVEGKMQTRSWEDNNGVKKYVTEVNVTQVEFLGSKQDQQQNQQQGQQQQNNYQGQQQGGGQQQQDQQQQGGGYREPSQDSFTADNIPF